MLEFWKTGIFDLPPFSQSFHVYLPGKIIMINKIFDEIRKDAHRTTQNKFQFEKNSLCRNTFGIKRKKNI